MSDQSAYDGGTLTGRNHEYGRQIPESHAETSRAEAGQVQPGGRAKEAGRGGQASPGAEEEVGGCPAPPTPVAFPDADLRVTVTRRPDDALEWLALELRTRYDRATRPNGRA